MSEEEFKIFILSSVVNLASENIQAGFWDPTNAVENATLQTEFLIKSGNKSGNHHFFSVFDDETLKKVGSLWIDIKENQPDMKSAFIYDITIQQEYRGNGYGKQTLVVLQNWLKGQGVKRIGLHVFAKNKVARNLYLDFGFIDNSFHMIKYI